MIYAHQISAKIAETRQQDLLRASRIRRIGKVTRTRNAQVRPQRKWLGDGRPAAHTGTCPTAA
jgi:hypothetical protein